jgi:hypothetical protein
VAIGMMLDVGASVMKHQAPRKPACGRRASSMSTTTASAVTASIGSHTSINVKGWGTP